MWRHVLTYKYEIPAVFINGWIWIEENENANARLYLIMLCLTSNGKGRWTNFGLILVPSHPLIAQIGLLVCKPSIYQTVCRLKSVTGVQTPKHNFFCKIIYSQKLFSIYFCLIWHVIHSHYITISVIKKYYLKDVSLQRNQQTASHAYNLVYSLCIFIKLM